MRGIGSGVLSGMSGHVRVDFSSPDTCETLSVKVFWGSVRDVRAEIVSQRMRVRARVTDIHHHTRSNLLPWDFIFHRTNRTERITK